MGSMRGQGPVGSRTRGAAELAPDSDLPPDCPPALSESRLLHVHTTPSVAVSDAFDYPRTRKPVGFASQPCTGNGS